MQGTLLFSPFCNKIVCTLYVYSVCTFTYINFGFVIPDPHRRYHWWFPWVCEGPGWRYSAVHWWGAQELLRASRVTVFTLSPRLSLPVMFWPHRHEWVKRQWYQHQLNNISMLNHKSQIWSLIMKVTKEITLTWPSLCSRVEVVFRCGLWLRYLWDDSVSPIWNIDWRLESGLV